MLREMQYSLALVHISQHCTRRASHACTAASISLSRTMSLIPYCTHSTWLHIFVAGIIRLRWLFAVEAKTNIKYRLVLEKNESRARQETKMFRSEMSAWRGGSLCVRCSAVEARRRVRRRERDKEKRWWWVKSENIFNTNMIVTAWTCDRYLCRMRRRSLGIWPRKRPPYTVGDVDEWKLRNRLVWAREIGYRQPSTIYSGKLASECVQRSEFASEDNGKEIALDFAWKWLYRSVCFACMKRKCAIILAQT